MSNPNRSANVKRPLRRAFDNLRPAILAVCLTASSCGPDASSPSAKFIVVNASGTRIDSILIEPDEKPGFWSLEAGDSLVYLSEMGGHPLVDGSYRLEYVASGTRKGRVFGYFSNGTPFEKGTRILILPDTVSIRHVF